MASHGWLVTLQLAAAGESHQALSTASSWLVGRCHLAAGGKHETSTAERLNQVAQRDVAADVAVMSATLAVVAQLADDRLPARREGARLGAAARAL